MTLEIYNKKREFDKTPEPRGKMGKNQGTLKFCVQKHLASHLHYDFRLELDGVLKSWPIPKGPSLNPKDKRLAMMVEDHPMDYINFEGNIPEGEYGAGEVIVWDIGTYATNPSKSKAENEKIIRNGLAKGHLDFTLSGKKLKGRFSLIKIRNNKFSKKDNAWLLIKKDDEYASDKDVTDNENSAISKKVLRNKKINGFAHIDKIFWPDEGYTKGDVINYYDKIAETILPYLIDRPESLNRHPDGIKGMNFYHKNITIKTPPFVKTASLNKVNYLVCNNKETLLYMANLGCIEINPWASRLANPDKPDFLIIDLDPGTVPFEKLIGVAKTAHKILESAKIPSFIKTSGKKGLHIAIPMGAKYAYEEVRLFAEIIARRIHAQIPDITSLERHPAKRKNRVYLDYHQNGRGQTLAAPYSLRPWPGATVSTPLKWSEVKAGLHPSKFTIKTIFPRLKKYGDLWKPVLGKGIDMDKSLKLLNRRVGL